MTHDATIYDDPTEGKTPQHPTTPAAQGRQKNIRIVNIRQLAGGNLRAFVDIGLGAHLTIKGFRIIQQPGQKAWVAPPQRDYTGPDGQRKYAPIVELTGDLKSDVERAILAAWAVEGAP